MSSLILSCRPISLLRNGYDLRVAQLCRQIKGTKHLVVVPLMPPETRPATIDMAAIFDSVETLDVDLRDVRSWRRHFRLSHVHYLRRAFPSAFDAATSRLHQIVSQTGVSQVVVFGSLLAELAREIDTRHILLDVCDSTYLTLRRELEFAPRPRRWSQRMEQRLGLRRWAAVEGALPGWFSQITTINDADSREILRLHGAPARNVHTIPNGVDERFLLPLTGAPQARGVAFWGNLQFPPNAQALHHFVHAIHQPYLRQRGVKLCVAGDDAPTWLLDAARVDPQIELLGFVEDLAEAVRRYPVMVNPMLIGSGMKNKVLEAFGLGLVVVTTTLGIESVPHAASNVHYLGADAPDKFADAIFRLLDDGALRERLRAEANTLLHQHYRWEVIGRRWRQLLSAA